MNDMHKEKKSLFPIFVYIYITMPSAGIFCIQVNIASLQSVGHSALAASCLAVRFSSDAEAVARLINMLPLCVMAFEKRPRNKINVLEQSNYLNLYTCLFKPFDHQKRSFSYLMAYQKYPIELKLFFSDYFQRGSRTKLMFIDLFSTLAYF